MSPVQGECVIVHTKDWEADDMSEISARLKSVSPGAVSQEFSLRRNQLGQLGFHVQHDGLITGESYRVSHNNCPKVRTRRKTNSLICCLSLE